MTQDSRLKTTKNIILLGLPGCGKSTLGKALAAKLQLPFIDLDKEIEETEGKPVPEIFAQKGEQYFRELEASCLRNVLARPGGIVLATGGGAPCFHDNMSLILEKGFSVYLEVPFEVLAERLFAEGVEKRPLLEGIRSTEGLVRLLEEKFAYRLPFYQKAKLHLLNNCPPEELIDKVQLSLKC